MAASPGVELTSLSACAAASAIRRGELGCEELVLAFLNRIARWEPQVHAFTDLDPDRAIEQARALDRQRGNRDGLLYGVPVAIKESFDVAGLRCTWGTPIHRERRPERDAQAVRRLRAAGAVVLGTTVCTEYTIAAAGPTLNPHDRNRTPGGSSSGSAAAVAARMAPLALGTQAVGSIVRPAIYCGVYGLKPTREAISTKGLMPVSRHLDHPGPMANSVEDLALACRVLFWRDQHDPASVGMPLPDAAEEMPSRILLVEGPLRSRIEPATYFALGRATQLLSEKAGDMRLRKVALPDDFDRAEDAIWTILSRDLARNHGIDRDRSGAHMSERLRSVIDRGRGTTQQEYDAALDQAARYRNYLLQLLESDSVILAPATDGVAPPLTEGTGSPALQGLWTLVGFPALAVPCCRFEGLPIGVQLIARPGRESLLFSTARMLVEMPGADRLPACATSSGE